MSDRPIQVGDLVVIMQACCDHKRVVGTLGRVTELATATTVCGKCRQPYNGRHAWFENCNHYGFPAKWLKRIPPMGELEGQRTEESLRDKEPS